jgi:hypothetical protein
LADKRTAAGIAQAALAVDVVRAFIRREIESRGERAALRLLERVADIAGDMAGLRAHLLYGIDPLAAVPLEDFRTTSALHKTRWPQILAAIDTKRAALRRVASRRKRKTT